MGPSESIRVALAQLNLTVGDIEGNVASIHRATERAREREANLLICPELTITGYPPGDLLTREAFVAAQLDALDRVAGFTDDDLALVVGYAQPTPEPVGKPLFNAAAVCRGGEVIARTYKRLLPTYDVFDEERYFQSATAGSATGPSEDRLATVERTDGTSATLGVSICEDAWNEPDFWERPLYDEDPIADLVNAGADLLVNLSASPYYLGKGAFRDRLFSTHAREHGRWLVFVNQVGGNDELVFDGRSLVVGPDGDIRRRLADFAEDFVVFDVPLADTSAGERGASNDEHSSRDFRATAERSPAAKAFQAITLGLRDYVHKSGFTDVIVGLSGGIDSSVTAALAAEALGPEHVTGVAMSTRYTSDASERDARRVADAFGIEFRSIPIDDTYAAFLDQLDPVLGDDELGVTEENLQARIRGTTLMALANEFGALVLAPGNASELATGYTTIYGDMVGALAPLGDCPKTLVYDLARHVNERRADGGAVIPRSVLEKAPSAELRPDQTDQDTLPPYEVLDSILDAYVEQGDTGASIVESGYDAETVRRVLGMLHGSEYKRWQAPPVLKLTQKAFGIGWRYPLAARYDAVIPADDRS